MYTISPELFLFMRVKVKEMTEEDHIIDEQSQGIFIEFIFTFYWQKANDKTNDYFPQDVKPNKVRKEI